MAVDQLKVLMTAFVAIILAVVFIGVIADGQTANTDVSNKVNESVSLTNNAGVTSQTDTVVASFFGNATNNTGTGTFMLLGTRVNVSSNGSIQVDSRLGSGPYNISYTYHGANYVVDSESRSLLSLTTLLFTLVALGIGLAAISASSDNFNFGFRR